MIFFGLGTSEAKTIMAYEENAQAGKASGAGSGSPRWARIERRTLETDVVLLLTLDGGGCARVKTGVGFFDHMLTLLARHGSLDLDIQAQGDLETGAHHTVEDVGICLGRALEEALGDKAGINRYGEACVPMDDALAQVALDMSGRPLLVWTADLLPRATVGGFDTDLAREFFQAVATNAHCTLHVRLLAGVNPHHMVEAMFKAFARAVRQAVAFDPRSKGVPSSKGVL